MREAVAPDTPIIIHTISKSAKSAWQTDLLVDVTLRHNFIGAGQIGQHQGSATPTTRTTIDSVVNSNLGSCDGLDSTPRMEVGEFDGDTVGSRKVEAKLEHRQ